MTTVKIPIGISSCLLGERVRFDGGHKNNSYIAGTLSDYFEFRAFCPEMAIGLGVPRETIRLVKDERDGDTRCVGVKNAEMDVTSRLKTVAAEQSHWVAHLSGYIFKKDSPSCGMERVKVYFNSNPERSGVGVYAGELMEEFPCLPTEEEGRLGDAGLRENFIKRVFMYDRWRQMIARGPARQDFVEFHTRHKLIYMSHNQNGARALGRLVASISTLSQEDFAEEYLRQMTALVKKPATRKNHVNVLQHIQGYLKRKLDAEDRQELKETIDQYRLGYLPLIVPITLLKHHFRREPDEFIGNSYYMEPHPKELMLTNSI